MMIILSYCRLHDQWSSELRNAYRAQTTIACGPFANRKQRGSVVQRAPTCVAPPSVNAFKVNDFHAIRLFSDLDDLELLVGSK
mgnify:CR=1 FL=1